VTHSAPHLRTASTSPRRACARCAAALLLVALAGYRFTLIHRGHFFWDDEQRYLAAAKLVENFERGTYRAGVAQLFTVTGRPVFPLVSVVPVLLQRYVGPRWGMPPDVLQSYDLAAAFNVVVSLGITVCVWGIARAWFNSAGYAGLAAAVFSLSCYANVWIRHLTPYYASLLMFLAALWLLSAAVRSTSRQAVRMAAAGGLSALGFACYPGYYAFVLINFVVALAVGRPRLRAVLSFALGGILVVAGFESLARAAGTSYVAELICTAGDHAAHVQGWPPEGFVFAWRYLRDVEGLGGLACLVLFLVAVARCARTAYRRDLAPAAFVALVMALACYLLHAAASVSNHHTAYLGRLFGMYLPFLSLGAAALVAMLRSVALRRLVVGGLVTASLVGFVRFARAYAGLTYPADLLAQAGAALSPPVRFAPDALLTHLPDGFMRTTALTDPRLALVQETLPEGPGDNNASALLSYAAARSCPARFIGVNLTPMIYVFEPDVRFAAPEGYRPLAEALHPAAFAPTLYETQRPWERTRLLQRRYTMRLYERADDDPAGTADRLSSRSQVAPQVYFAENSAADAANVALIVPNDRLDSAPAPAGADEPVATP
jgi:hypothetical protein